MNDNNNNSKIEIHQNFNDSNVFIKDKKVNINIKTI